LVLCSSFFSLIIARRPPCPTLLPYTTLFRSVGGVRPARRRRFPRPHAPDRGEDPIRVAAAAARAPHHRGRAGARRATRDRTDQLRRLAEPGCVHAIAFPRPRAGNGRPARWE